MGEQRTASKGPFRLSLAKKRQQPAMDPHAAAASLYASPPPPSSSSRTAVSSKSSKSSPPPPPPPPLSAASPSISSLSAGSTSAASSSAASPASFAHEDIDEELLNDQEAMAIAVAASNSWFSSPAPDDDDDDSLFSGRHGGDDDDDAESHYDEAWKAQDPIVLGAREALESAEPAFPRAEARDEGTAADPAAAAAAAAAAPLAGAPATTAPPLQRGLSRTRTTKQGGGILSRLMRISRKEARAAEAAAAAAATSPSSAPSSARPVVVTAAAVPEASTGDIFTTMKTQSPATEVPPAGPSAAGAAGVDVARDPLTLRDAGIERVPLMVQDEERPQHGRIHSVEPSLVDDESIADRSELSFVEGGFDIDDGDDDDEEQGTALDALQDEQQSVPSSPWQLSGHESQQPSTASSFKDALSRQASETASLQLQPPGDRGDDDDDEDQPTPTATPKATAPDPGQSSYFDNSSTPSAAAATATARPSRQEASAQSAASPEQRKDTSPSQRKSGSPSQRKSSSSPTQQRKKTIPALTSSSSVANGPQLRHYLLRRLVDVELRHELERLWMLASLDEAWQPADPAGLAKRDLACFKLDPHRRAPYLPRTALVRPLARAMLSCPLFGPAVPIEGAAAARSRAAGARKFIDEGLLPLARHLQALSLSDEMDRRPHAYHAQTQTMSSALKGALLSVVARFLVSSLERQPPSREREPPLALAGWAWSSVEPPPLAAYMGHRLPANKLRQGGMEVDIVGARARQGSGGSADEFLIAVRRYGHPPSFVVRTEGDFVKLAKGLATELGPRRRVRAVPGPTASGALETQPSSVYGGSTKRNLSSSSLNTGDGTAGGTSRSASVPVSLPASGSLSSAKGDGFRRLASGANTSQVSMASTAAAPSPSAKRNSFGLLRSPKADVDGDEKRGASRFFSNNRSSSSLASTSTKQGAAAPAAGTDETAGSETDIESRRKQLRAWLRDALSIRGAGHSDEGRHFLGVAAFGEREMRHATRLDMDARARLDRDNIALRADAARSAAEDVLDLRDELEALGQACLGGSGGGGGGGGSGGDGFPKAHEALRSAATFGALPLPYQRAVSWANLRLAYALHGVFVNQAQATSSANFARLQDGYAAVPWKMLALALREPTGLMIAKVRAAMTKPSVVDRLIALVVGEDPSGSSATATQDYERQVAELKRRLGSALSRKLHDFVWECSDHKKRLIRDAARRADIPLVCAIARGSDKPLLATDGVKRIVAATRTYKAFFATRPAPTPDEVLAKQRANVDVRLITDMQALLRLLSAKRDGAKLRAALKDPAVRQPIEALVEPLLNVVRRVHKSNPPSSSGSSSTDLLNGFKDFIASLIDVLGGLRARVQDPWRSIATLALFLDDAVPAWYAVLHRFASRVPDGHGHGQSQSQGQSQSLAGRLVQDLFGWLASLGALRLDGSPAAADVVLETCSSTPSSSETETGGTTSVDTFARHLAQQHRARRTRQMEAAARWAAGDIDADHAIQLQGADAGKTRTKPFLLDEAPLRPAASAAMLDVEDRLARAFGETLSHS